MARDYTRYTVKGLGENLNKRQLVFTIVKDWTSKNNPTLEELQAAFPDSIQGSKGFIVKESEVKDTKRFNMQEPLTIKNGNCILVSNQWGSKNIDTFLTTANKLGYIMGQVSKNIETKANSATDADFDITKLSLREFKKLLNNIKDKEAFEKSLTKQVEMNIDFWSYMLVYDSHINDNTLILSMDNMDDAADVFQIEWWEIGDEEQSLAQFVMDKIDYDFEEVQLDDEKRIHYIASFGSYLYFSLVNFAGDYDCEDGDLAGFLASNDHTMTRDGEDVFDTHSIGDDWIVTMADQWLMYCGFDSSDYDDGEEYGVHLVNAEFKEFGIDYLRMAEDIRAHFE